MSPALDLGHLNDLNDDVVVEVDVKEALKLSIFIVQKTAAPKSGVEFRQGSIGRGGIRGGAREHCSQKKMDRTIFGRRILAKFTALVVIFIKRAIYHTSAVGPMKNTLSFAIYLKY